MICYSSTVASCCMLRLRESEIVENPPVHSAAAEESAAATGAAAQSYRSIPTPPEERKKTSSKYADHSSMMGSRVPSLGYRLHGGLWQSFGERTRRQPLLYFCQKRRLGCCVIKSTTRRLHSLSDSLKTRSGKPTTRLVGGVRAAEFIAATRAGSTENVYPLGSKLLVSELNLETLVLKIVPRNC